MYGLRYLRSSISCSRVLQRGFSTTPVALKKFKQPPFDKPTFFKVNANDKLIPGWKEPEIDLEPLDIENTKLKLPRNEMWLHILQYEVRKKIDDTAVPVVFLHGLYGSSSNYRSVAKSFTNSTRIPTYGIDLRAHGVSPDRPPWNYETMARDVIHTLRRNDLTKVALVGHSMGAKVAMLVALLEPKMVKELVVVDNSPVNEPLDYQFYRQLVGLAYIERSQKIHGMKLLSDMYREAERILKKYEPSSLTRAYLLSNLRPDHKTRIRVPVLNFLKFNVLDRLGEWPSELVEGKQFHKKVKVIRGLKSDFIKDENIKNDFPKYFTDFEVEDFDTGHWVIFDEPKKFLSILRSYIHDRRKANQQKGAIERGEEEAEQDEAVEVTEEDIEVESPSTKDQTNDTK